MHEITCYVCRSSVPLSLGRGRCDTCGEAIGPEVLGRVYGIHCYDTLIPRHDYRDLGDGRYGCACGHAIHIEVVPFR